MSFPSVRSLPGPVRGRRTRRSYRALAVLAVVAAACACGREEPALFRVVERLDSPEGADRTAEVGTPSPAARTSWSAAEIDETWTRVSTAGRTLLRSPALDLPRDEPYAIRVSLAAAGAAERVVLLWGDGGTLSPPDFARNRRELTPDGRRTNVEVPGREIREADLRGGAPRRLRHLFLHVPARPGGRGAVESVALILTSDLLASAPPGPTRMLLDGESREVLVSPGPALAFRLASPPGTEIRLGARLPPATPAGSARVTVGVGETRTVLADRPLRRDRWSDFSLRLPAAPELSLELAVESAGSPVPAYWKVPIVFGPEASPARANVVLYVVDALRADRVEEDPSRRGAAPFLRDLARRGTTFRRAYTAATWTKPSVASLLTSLHPGTHALGARHYSDPLPESVRTLQEALGRAGYVTGQFTANAFAGTLSGLDRGFDDAFMPGAFHGPESPDGGEKITAGALNAKVLPWLEANRDRLFFLYVHSVDAHPPWMAPGTRPGAGAVEAYDAAVAYADAELRRLHSRIESLGLTSRTVFVVTADHGEAFGEHGRHGHGQTVFEEEARVPLVLHIEGRSSAAVEHPVSLVDVMPTLLELCSVRAEPGLQGRSLLPRHGPPGGAAPVFVTRFVYPEDLDAVVRDAEEAHAVVLGRWKLVATGTPSSSRTLALFDLESDPGETRDVSREEPAVVRRLADALEGFLSSQSRERARLSLESPADTEGPSDDAEARRQLRSLGYIR